MSVLLGNGDGTFQAPINLMVAAGNVSYVAVDDFNRDGNPDIVAASFQSDDFQGNTLSLLLGNGDGTFQTFQGYFAGPNTYYVTTGDFNNDGFPDVAVGNFDAGQVSVLLNNADWAGPLAWGTGNSVLAGQRLMPAPGTSLKSDGPARETAAGRILLNEPEVPLLSGVIGHTEQPEVQARDGLFSGFADAFPALPL